MVKEHEKETVKETGANAAIYYDPDAYDTTRPRLMGRHAAGEGFLKGFAAHAAVDRLVCYARSRTAGDDFARRVARLAGRERPCRWVPFVDLAALAEPGCLFMPGPGIDRPAWQRRHVGGDAYSLCGVTHTIASQRLMDVIGALLIAPLQPWDALICTSQAVRDAVEHVLGQWGAYLEERFGAAARPAPRLPVIPLGVDCDALAPATPAAQAARAKLRRAHGIDDGDVAVLFVGRLSFHAKAHPAPMYLALEEAARRGAARIHLVQAGWFANESIERDFKEAARTCCPSVRAVFLDGRQPEVRAGVWFAADAFTSLSDNIQETFGLAPVEAMAAGLPVVVSDWNGYRDTVRSGVDGFTVPTVMPPPGLGGDLALRHDLGVDSYDFYIGAASQCVGVDIAAAAAAYARLAGDPELRRTMGAAGRRRAEERFDWRVVIAAYQELWRELGERRRAGGESAPRRAPAPADPLRDDPFALFAGYPSRLIALDAVISPAPGGDAAARLARLCRLRMNTFAAELLASGDERDAVLRHLADTGPCAVRDLLALFPGARAGRVHRTLGWLAKYGLVRIDAPVVRRDGGGESR